MLNKLLIHPPSYFQLTRSWTFKALRGILPVCPGCLDLLGTFLTKCDCARVRWLVVHVSHSDCILWTLAWEDSTPINPPCVPCLMHVIDTCRVSSNASLAFSNIAVRGCILGNNHFTLKVGRMCRPLSFNLHVQVSRPQTGKHPPKCFLRQWAVSIKTLLWDVTARFL